MDSIVIDAPAKVNLFLKVIDKRPDGYHDIETLFEKIALFDRIRLEKDAGGIEIQSNKKNLPGGAENLTYQAAHLLRKKGALSGVKIEIEKSIPIGAGLGGGSSDAAAVLMGLNRLYDLRISIEELGVLAGELGADVPFFLSEKTYALGKNRGDSIEGVESSLKLWHILIIPSFCVLSRDAYKWIDRQKKEDPDIDRPLAALKENDIEALGRNLYNALEDISFEKEVLLKNFKKILIEYGARGSVISGSGPALFGIVEEEEEVMRLKKRLERQVRATDKNWQVLVASTYE